MKTTIKRVLAWMLCAALCLGMTLMHALAQTSEPQILVTPGNEINIYVGQTKTVTAATNFGGKLSCNIQENGTCDVSVRYGDEDASFSIAGKAPGTMQFTVWSVCDGQQITKTITVTVTDEPRILVTPGNEINIYVGQTKTVTAATNFGGKLSCNIQENGTCDVCVHYGDGDASFDIAGKAPGTMQITLSSVCFGASVTQIVTVHVLPLSELPKPQITVRMRYKDQDTIRTNFKATWLSTDEDVVTVDPQTGAFKTVGVGSAAIVAISEDGEIRFTCEIEVRYAWWQQLIRVFLFGFLWY